jgi:hypothetical protein
MYIIDAFMTVEGNRLKWIRENQQTILAENYTTLYNYVNSRQNQPDNSRANTNIETPEPISETTNTTNSIPLDDFGRPRPVQCWNHLSFRQRQEQRHTQQFEQQQSQWRNRQARILSERLAETTQEPLLDDGEVVGQRLILPSTFQGSERQSHESYLDAMAVVAKYGKPDLFITMTANAQWREILENMATYHDSNYRPDLHARVMRLKLAALIRQIRKELIFGKPIAYIHVIEFQKRGLPHAHILITLAREDKIVCCDDIDNIVCAELPNQLTHPRLFEIVTKCMIHGPCGQLNPHSGCMQNEKNICNKDYPKEFQEHTIENDSKTHKAIYRRRNNGIVFEKMCTGIRGPYNHSFDNRDVVPYNALLLLNYNCHINVEVCSSIRSVKYLYKYVYKGHDRANVCIQDEIKSFIKCRYLCAQEA